MGQDFKQDSGRDILPLVLSSCCLLLRLISVEPKDGEAMNFFLVAEMPLLKAILGTDTNHIVSQMPMHYLPHGTS